MAEGIKMASGAVKTAAPAVVQGTFQRPAAQIPAGYELVYRMGGPRYMYGETPFYGARYADGGTVPGQIYGNMRGSREGADMFGFFPTMFQSQPYATASQMYTPSLGVMPLIGYPSKYPHVVMGGYTDYGAPIANQAINMMLPLLMMGLYRQMFPMQPQAPAATLKSAGSGGGGGKSGGSETQAPADPKRPPFAVSHDQSYLRRVSGGAAAAAPSQTNPSLTVRDWSGPFGISHHGNVVLPMVQPPAPAPAPAPAAPPLAVSHGRRQPASLPMVQAPLAQDNPIRMDMSEALRHVSR
jgi:hypothetical protein